MTWQDTIDYLGSGRIEFYRKRGNGQPVASAWLDTLHLVDPEQAEAVELANPDLRSLDDVSARARITKLSTVEVEGNRGT